MEMVPQMIYNYLSLINGLSGVLEAMKVRMFDQMQNNIGKTDGQREQEKKDIFNLEVLLQGTVKIMTNMLKVFKFATEN